MGAVRHVSRRVAVMYLGRFVELGKEAALFPSPLHPPAGCHLHPRRPKAQERCRQLDPEFREERPGHWVRCHFPGP